MWINGISENLAKPMSNVLKATDMVSGISISPALSETISKLYKFHDSEVRNRPAVEQSTVCTP